MRRGIVLLTGLLLTAAPAFATEFSFEYDRAFAHTAVTTFTYVDTPSTNHPDGLMSDRIKAGIIRELTGAGLEQVEAGGDVFVTYHMTTKDVPILNTMGHGYSAAGTDWGAEVPDKVSVPPSQVAYEAGTLVVDAYNPEDKKLIWRGTARMRLDQDPGYESEQLDGVLAKMGKKWQKLRAKAKKEEAAAGAGEKEED